MDYYFWCFILYSFIGFVLETIFALFTVGRLVNRKTMRVLPLCPVYGIGATAILLIFEQLPVGIFTVFFVSIVIGTVVEYMYGFLCERIFNVTLWDYSDSKGNYKGLVSLPFSAIWGILALALIYFIHPFFRPFVLPVSPVFTLPAVFLFLIDAALTVDLLLKIGKGYTLPGPSPVMRQKTTRS